MESPSARVPSELTIVTDTSPFFAGYPAKNGLVSVTIVSSDGTLADGLSTSLFIMGEEKAAEFWKAHSNEFEAIFATDDGTIYVTEGLKDSFTTDLDMKVITK